MVRIADKYRGLFDIISKDCHMCDDKPVLAIPTDCCGEYVCEECSVWCQGEDCDALLCWECALIDEDDDSVLCDECYKKKKGKEE